MSTDTGSNQWYKANLVGRDDTEERWQITTVKIKAPSSSGNRLDNAFVYVDDDVLCGVLPNAVQDDQLITLKCNNGNGIIGTSIKV